MSEFSCSYHLKSENIHDCVNLIKRAGVSGYIFPSINGWVSFVVDEQDFKFSKKLIDSNDGVLLNFINAEDHGWSFEIYDKDKKVCKFECNYDNGKKFSYEKYIENRDILFDDNQSKVLDKIFSADKKELLKNDANKFAESMGLHLFEWLSYDYVCHDPGSYSEYKIIKVKKKKEKIERKKSNSENMEIFNKTQSRSKKFHQYTIKVYAKAVNKPDKIEAFVFIHPNENPNEGYFYQDLFGDNIVFK